MSISDLSFAFPKRHTITFAIPQCFTDLIEYVYKMPYDDAIESMELGTIKDDIQLGLSGNICTSSAIKVDENKIIKVVVVHGGRFPIFKFVCQDNFDRHAMNIAAYEDETSKGIIAWILMQSNSDFLNALTGNYEVPELSISPYYAIDFIVKHKDENALYALCSYAFTQNEFNVLIEGLARANAVEETALALRWNHDIIQANISAWNNPQDKFEL